MKYDWAKLTVDQKRLAVKREMELVTHNGTTKEDFVNIMHFQKQEFDELYERARDRCEDLMSKTTNLRSDLSESDKTIKLLAEENEQLKIENRRLLEEQRLAQLGCDSLKGGHNEIL